jgi:putative ABC transport system substrate-binding protein
MTTQPLSTLTMLLSRHTRRRDFITPLGGAATWPLAARAQQPDRMRRVGILMNGTEIDPELHARIAAFRTAFQKLGWTEGRNVQVTIRWVAGNLDKARGYAEELVGP